MIYKASHVRRDRIKAQNRRKREALEAIVSGLSIEERAAMSRIKGNARESHPVTIDGHTWALLDNALAEDNSASETRQDVAQAARQVADNPRDQPSPAAVLEALGIALAEYAVIDELLDSLAGSSPEGLTAKEASTQRRSNATRNKLQKLFEQAIKTRSA